MFAGPNGSGKSVLKSYLSPELLGTYLNADEIEAEIKGTGRLDMRRFDFEIRHEDVLSFFTDSDFLKSRGLSRIINRSHFAEGCLHFPATEFNSYLASVLVDFLRTRLLDLRRTFTFETVMSHSSKVQLLQTAQSLGYRTYLYYVATDDPEINISRVKNRVKLNGHDVPDDIVIKRYHRSLDLLIEGIRHSNRAYIFDNSTDNAERKHTWLAEVTNGTTLEIKAERVPAWFRRAVLDKIR